MARRATYMVDGRFFGYFFFWKVEGTVRIHVNSRVAHMWLPYRVINVQVGGGGGNEHQKTQKIWKFLNLHKGDREHCRPYWISWMVAILNNQRWQPFKIDNFISKAYFGYLRCLTYCWWRGAYDHWRSITECPWLPIVAHSNKSVSRSK